MSITLMAEVWKTGLPSTQKMVLLALADNCNDQGECYPSIQTVAKKCSLSERAVQKALVVLEVLGYVTRIIRMGRSTLYCVQTTPEHSSPPNNVRPERDSPQPRTTFTVPPNHVHHGGERGSPITTTITTNESSQPQPIKSSKFLVADLIWPKCFEFDQDKHIALKKLMHVGSIEQAQVILDEISGNQRAGKKIKYPQRYLDKLIGLSKTKALSPELAHIVKAQREGAQKFSSQETKKADPQKVAAYLARIQATYQK